MSEGFGSLFTCCTGALQLAEHAAYNRIEAARASRRFPAILDLLADGSLNLSTLRLLAPHLTAGNFAALVASATAKSKREVEVLVAGFAPRADVPASVRRLPSTAPVVLPHLPAEPGRDGPSAATLLLAPPLEGRSADRATLQPVTRPDRPVRPALVTPLTAERFQVKFTIGTATHQELREAQDLLRREIPDGDPGEIFDRALTLLLEDVARRKCAWTSPLRRKPGSASRP